jgi:hypothetical protein
MRAPIDRVRARRVDAAELGAAAGRVRLSLLADEDMVDRLPVANRDVAVRTVKRARDRDVLGDEERAVARDRYADVRAR